MTLYFVHVSQLVVLALESQREKLLDPNNHRNIDLTPRSCVSFKSHLL